MTFAGKRLQSIYNSGAEQLAESEIDLVGKLKHMQTGHAERIKQDVDDCAIKVRKTASDLKSDLAEFIDGSIDRIKNTMDQELNEIQNHTGNLMNELVSLSDRLKASIDEVKRIYEENVDQLSLSASDHYLGTVDEVRHELGKQNRAVSQRLKTHSSSILSSFQQNLDHILGESRGEAKQDNTTLWSTYKEKADTIDSHFSVLVKKLASEFHNQDQLIEAASKRAEGEVQAASKSLMQRVDEHSEIVEKQITEFFNLTAETLLPKLDNDLSNYADELGDLHDTTTQSLGQVTEEFSATLTDSAELAKGALQGRCTEVREKVDESIAALVIRLQERVATSLAVKNALESEKEEILRAIRNDISQVCDGFERRVKQLINESKDRISAITGNAERDIFSAQKRYEDQVELDSRSSRVQVEEEISKLLQLITQHRSTALDEIKKAAASSSGIGSVGGMDKTQEINVDKVMNKLDVNKIDNPNPNSSARDTPKRPSNKKLNSP